MISDSNSVNDDEIVGLIWLHDVTGSSSTDYYVVDEDFYNVRRWKRLRKTRNLKRCPMYLRMLARYAVMEREGER